MKKNLYFILLIMSSLLAACKKEPKEEVVGYRFTYSNEFPNMLFREFLFLFDGNNKILKEKEVGTTRINELTTTQNNGSYSIGHFKEGDVYQNKKSFYYDIVRDVPNGKNWNFNHLQPFFLHTFTAIETNLSIKNLPKLDSFYLKESKVSNDTELPLFDASKKELKYSCFLVYADFSYIYIREHKDSSFRYALLKMPNMDLGGVQTLQLDYNEMRKAKVVEFQPKEDFRIIKIIASINGGILELFKTNWNINSNTIHLVLPEEAINSYYAECRYAKEKNFLVFFDKVSELSKIVLRDLPLLKESIQSNGQKKLELASGKLLMVQHLFFKGNKSNNLSLKETLPYKNENIFNRVAPELPQNIIGIFKDLKELKEEEHSINLFHLRNANLDYSTFLEKYFNYYNYQPYKFDTWVYDVGYSVNYYND